MHFQKKNDGVEFIQLIINLIFSISNNKIYIQTFNFNIISQESEKNGAKMSFFLIKFSIFTFLPLFPKYHHHLLQNANIYNIGTNKKFILKVEPFFFFCEGKKWKEIFETLKLLCKYQRAIKKTLLLQKKMRKYLFISTLLRAFFFLFDGNS